MQCETVIPLISCPQESLFAADCNSFFYYLSEASLANRSKRGNCSVYGGPELVTCSNTRHVDSIPMHNNFPTTKKAQILAKTCSKPFGEKLVLA